MPVPRPPTAFGRARRRVVDRVKIEAYKAGGRIAPLLPDGPATILADGGKRLIARAMRDRRFMVERHMRRALGPEASDRDVQSAVDDAFASYARYWVETFRLGGYGREKVESILTVDGYEHFTSAANVGGTILALPHLGQWEVAGAWVGLQGFRLTAVVEELDPPEVYEWFRDLREKRFGMHAISASDPAVAKKVVRALHEGDVVALLSDRDMSRHGPEVTFFGERTTLPAGPASLAIHTGVPVLPAAVYETGKWRYRGVVRPPLRLPSEGTKAERVAAMTQELAFELEGLIRRAPSQWHLLQPNWPSDREALRERRARNLLRGTG